MNEGRGGSFGIEALTDAMGFGAGVDASSRDFAVTIAPVKIPTPNAAAKMIAAFIRPPG